MSYIGGKQDRKLVIFRNLLEGKPVNVKDASEYYGVSTRTIQRDIDGIRNFFYEIGDKTGEYKEVIYDRKNNNYYINGRGKLDAKEIFAVCKILLESRAFCKDEFMPILDRLIEHYSYDDEKMHIKKMVANEKFHYVEPQHRKSLIDNVWKLSQAIRDRKTVKIKYERLTKPRHQERIIEPVGIMFSDYYFYLAAFIPEKKTDYPTIYRIDRLESFEILNETFKVPYKNRFEEGEFRKRVQFMYGGDLLRVKFKYYGESVEAILDRLPTAEIISSENGVYTIKAEVFGRGIKPWILSQADKIEVLEPQSLRNEIITLLKTIICRYSI